MEYLRSIYLDLNASPSALSVKAKQGDAVYRLLEISTTKDGQPYTPDGVASYQFRCFKPDGNAVILEGTGAAAPIVAGSGVYTVTLSEQCLAVAGRCRCDLAFLDSSGNTLSTATFCLEVMPMPDIGSLVESSTEWERLMAAIQAAEDFSSVLSFRVQNGNFQYTADGTNWQTICPTSDFVDTITDSEIDALFE